MRCFGKSNAKAVQKKKAILQNETISVDLTLVDSTTVEVLVDRRLRPLHEVSHPPRQVDGTHGSQYAQAWRQIGVSGGNIWAQFASGTGFGSCDDGAFGKKPGFGSSSYYGSLV